MEDVKNLKDVEFNFNFGNGNKSKPVPSKPVPESEAPVSNNFFPQNLKFLPKLILNNFLSNLRKIICTYR